MRQLIFDASRLSVSREYYETNRPKIVGFSTWLIVTLFVILLSLTFVFQIEEVVRGNVTIRPLEQVSAVINPLSGTVADVFFEDGEHIEQGDLLYVIDTVELEAQIDSYEVKLDHIHDRHHILTGLREMMLSREHGHDLVDPESIHRLANFLYATEHYRLAIEEANNELERERLKPVAYTSEASIEQLQSSVDLIKSEYNAWREESFAEVYREIRVLEEDRASLVGELEVLRAQQKSASVVASISGTVQLFREINPGDRLAQDEQVLQIVPTTQAEYRVHVELLPQDVADLERGLPMRVQFSSLPPSEYGFVHGRISSIPADATFGTDNMPVFLIEGVIPTYVVSKRGEVKVNLRPGMIGEARIIRRKKSVAFFILELMDFWN